MRRLRVLLASISVLIFFVPVFAQINAKQVINIGRNALYFEDYILSIQYFNQAIKAKPYLAEPYFYRGIAKLYLEDYRGAEEDCSLAIERNPFITDAYQIRGVARQSLHKYQEAIDDYSTGLQLNPEEKNMLFNKALAEVAIKDYDAASVTYEDLISKFPKYDNAYLGKAQMLIEIGDTLLGVENISKAIEVNKNNSQAYLMRAGIGIKQKGDGFVSALADMDAAIKLEPNNVDFFINRAYLRYQLDDYFGAMSDFDYAVSLEPNNKTARYNRALLLIEVKENNRAIVDLTEVIAVEPENVFARYNRASLYASTGQYKLAIEDFDAVIEVYPDLGSIIYERSMCKKNLGDISGAEKDYYAARSILDNKQNYAKYLKSTVATTTDEGDGVDSQEREVSEQEVIDKFKQLMTVNTERDVEPKYDNKTRGRIQDDSDMVVAEEIFTLSYYDQASAVKVNNNYTKETDEINQSRLLPMTIFVTNKPLSLTSAQVADRFNSKEYFSSNIFNGRPRIVDYVGRALDFLLLKDYNGAIADLDAALTINPNYTLAYFLKAIAKLKLIESEASEVTDDNNKLKGIPSMPNMVAANERIYHSNMMEVVKLLDITISLSPSMIYAYFNKGCVLMEIKDYTGALSCFNSAIEIKPEFAEAYYNRGLAYLQLGNQERAFADLSKAGELGILPSYSILKRMATSKK